MPKYKHYTEAIPEIKALRASGRNEELEDLLKWCVDSTEAESRRTGAGVAPSYYEDLAKLYRKQKRRDEEVEILARFSAQKHSPGAMPAKLLERLDKLRV